MPSCGAASVYWTLPLPLAVHILIATAATHLAFTIWHEAAHRNVSSRPWVNNVVGIAGVFPVGARDEVSFRGRSNAAAAQKPVRAPAVARVATRRTVCGAAGAGPRCLLLSC